MASDDQHDGGLTLHHSNVAGAVARLGTIKPWMERNPGAAFRVDEGSHQQQFIDDIDLVLRELAGLQQFDPR